MRILRFWSAVACYGFGRTDNYGHPHTNVIPSEERVEESRDTQTSSGQPLTLPTPQARLLGGGKVFGLREILRLASSLRMTISRRPNPVRSATIPCWVSIFAAGSVIAEEPIDFNRDIRPIISENCVHCHGPDAETREAGLRLDEEAASRDAIVPGDANASEVWLRVAHDDPDELMPPPDSNRSLTAKQKDLLKRWINSGAKYAKHWAYVAPKKAAVPKGEHAVDHFIAKGHAEKGLGFSAEAEKWRLLRRVSLDLIGLPPSPEEVKAFLADESPDAFEKQVDRLLASPRFGEKWARSWLDLARYADSNGFQADQLRDSWAYRDYVINAFNANMPFDQFTIEQLAGDLLPNATVDQKIATGFHRTPTCNVEAGVHPEENRTNQVVDRVNTTGTVWLGTTMECAQCHDHKYDPFSMKEYYELFAYFNNTPVEVENPSGKGVSFNFYGPKMELPMSAEKEATRKKLTAELDVLKKKRAQRAKAVNKEYGQWIANAGKKQAPVKWRTVDLVKFSATGGETSEPLGDGSHLVKGPQPEKTIYQLKLSGIEGKVGAIRVETLTHKSLSANGPGRGNGDRPNIILSEIRVKDAKGKEVKLIDAVADYSQPSWDVSQAIDGDLRKGWAIGKEFGKDHWAAFEVADWSTKQEDVFTVELEQNYGIGRTIGRFRISVADRFPSEDALPNDIAKLLTKTKRSDADNKKLKAHFEKNHPVLKSIDTDIAKVQKSLKAVTPDTTLVMVEKEEPRETHMMMRGNYLDKGEKVTAATPAVLHAASEELPANRLGFAQWLMQPDNPLVARVTVNRWWAEVFGTGLVKTVEDLGTQSEPPTHPELLDWLAVEFAESGWDMKHILRTMVTSKAYRQNSAMTHEKWVAADPENRFLARGPRFRMSAEMIRDNALAVTGLLSTKMGGKPIMPYQPPGMWRQVGRNEPKWIDAKDEDRFRRGIYIVYRRAAPYPSFVNFDAPDRSSCAVSRPRTNTPLQALTLLNDPAYTEMALAMANRVLTEKKDSSLAEQIEFLYQHVLCRKPAPTEVEHLSYLVEQKIEAYTEDGKAAQELIDGGSSAITISKDIPKEKIAAWFYLTNVILNLDETVTKG